MQLSSKIIMKDGVPFTKYWQGNDYLFHPMQAGRWLFSNATIKNYHSLMKISHELSNGALVWYYSGYKVLRMKGRSIYSCISQCEFLTAFMRLHSLNIIEGESLKKVFKSYTDTEIDFKGKALIELPLDYSCPEIVLNGWLHALSRIIDYYKYSDDKNAKQLLDNNIKYLSEILPLFDNEIYKLSTYSDLCPYVAKVIDSTNLTISYNEEVFDFKPRNDHYSVKLISKNKNTKIINFPVSSRYDIILKSDSPFTLLMHTGKYKPNSSSVSQDGKLITLKSEKGTENYFIKIPSEKLFAGYPTNFAKADKNYYHVYHVVALKCIAETYPTKYSDQLLLWSSKWKDYMDHRPFENLEYVAEHFNRGKYFPYNYQ